MAAQEEDKISFEGLTLPDLTTSISTDGIDAIGDVSNELKCKLGDAFVAVKVLRLGKPVPEDTSSTERAKVSSS